MSSRNTTLGDLDATPEEKRLSRIAADIWGVDPVRYGDDGHVYPLMRLDNPDSDGHENLYRGRLGRIGVFGSSDYPDCSIREGWWTPVYASDGKPVMQGGEYRYVEAAGLVYENCDSMYDDLPTALLKALDFEKNGTPRERPSMLGAGLQIEPLEDEPLMDLEEWRSRYSDFF